MIDLGLKLKLKLVLGLIDLGMEGIASQRNIGRLDFNNNDTFDIQTLLRRI